jgi:hypothetical protein
MANFFRSILHIVTILGVIAAFNEMALTFDLQTGAPQQAVVVARAILFVVAPYCLARAVEQLAGR